jgi:spermidine synthase
MLPVVLNAIIFISGGAILALELLASRIMTPYFGVSLYIWTGILSITLVSLALGYWLGGRRASAGASSARVLQLFALMPALAALGVVAACAIYPHAFAAFATWSLIGGAFAACMVLLFIPLVATSAMNPLLVALLLRREADARTGDAGAGKVFFVSTLGSVAGVFVTAFGLIPYLSNFASALVVGLVLAALTLAAVFFAREPLPNKAGLGVFGAAAAVLAALLLANADSYTGRQGPFTYGAAVWRVEASFSSLFGTVKVLRTAADADTGRYLRMYFQDGLNQNTADSNNRSSSFYTYALEGLARAYRPEMHGVLVLGLGAGMVPMRLAALDVPVEVVDIDPVAKVVAQSYFGFDPQKAATHQADARTFVQRCKGGYDVAVVDLFHGDGTPDYLVTREFFHDLRSCLALGGIAVFNTFAHLADRTSYAHFLVTLKAELPHLALYRPAIPGATHVNSFVVASAQPLPAPAKVTFDDVPPRHQEALWNMLSAPTPLSAELFEGGRLVTDAASAAALDYARMQVVYRRSVVEAIPPGMLMN